MYIYIYIYLFIHMQLYLHIHVYIRIYVYVCIDTGIVRGLHAQTNIQKDAYCVHAKKDAFAYRFSVQASRQNQAFDSQNGHITSILPQTILYRNPQTLNRI